MLQAGLGTDHTFVSPEAHLGEMDGADPRAILEWAVGTMGRLAVATSFQSSGLVILHLLKDIAADMPVLFLNTGFHFPETLAFRDEIVARWGLHLVELTGEHGNAAGQAARHGPELYRTNPNLCCHINKVEPLQRVLEDYDGWISGIRRDQSPFRAETPVVEAQMLPSGREVFKVHPLANWSRVQVGDYLATHDIPVHPLLEQGFASIGCFPCTRAVQPGEDERAGRWEGTSKTECGIHSFGKPGGPAQSEAEQ